MSLKKQTFLGLFWGFFSQGGKQVVQFLITAILARLLSPNDFGLLGMATVFTGFVSIFSEMGMSSALIQKREVTEDHYDSAFWLNLVVGGLLSLSMLAVAPWIAAFYGQPLLAPILSVIGINFFISSFVIVQRAFLEKRMEFKKVTIVELFAVTVSGVVGVVAARSGQGVWSLVYQTLTLTVGTAIGLWIFSTWRPRFRFSKTAISEIFSYSANLTGFNIVNYFSRNLDYLLIGKFLGAEPLGYYTLAYKLMLYPLQNITSVVTRVTFPAFSKIQHDLVKLQAAYLKMIRAISLVTFPLMAGIFVLAPELIMLMFGQKWAPAIVLIRIFCFSGMIQSVGTTVGSIRLSVGESRQHLRMGIFNAVVAGIVVAVSLRWGVVGVAINYTLFSWWWYHYSAHVTLKLIGLNLRSFVAELVPAYTVSIVLTMLLFAVKILLNHEDGWMRTLTLAVVSIPFYFALLFLTKQFVLEDRRRLRLNF